MAIAAAAAGMAAGVLPASAELNSLLVTVYAVLSGGGKLILSQNGGPAQG
jgi:hypothetical protein